GPHDGKDRFLRERDSLPRRKRAGQNHRDRAHDRCEPPHSRASYVPLGAAAPRHPRTARPAPEGRRINPQSTAAPLTEPLLSEASGTDWMAEPNALWQNSQDAAPMAASSPAATRSTDAELRYRLQDRPCRGRQRDQRHAPRDRAALRLQGQQVL